MATALNYPHPQIKASASVFDDVRSFLTEIACSQTEYYPSELHRLAYERRTNLPGLSFRFGSVRPYSEQLDDVLSVLLVNGELQLNSADSCRIIISEALRRRIGQR